MLPRDYHSYHLDLAEQILLTYVTKLQSLPQERKKPIYKKKILRMLLKELLRDMKKKIY